MNQATYSSNIVEIDLHKDMGWLHVLIITDQEIAVTSLKTQEFEEVSRRIKKQDNPIGYAEEARPFGSAFTVIKLEDLVHVEWHEDDVFLKLFFKDTAQEKLNALNAHISSPQSREHLLEAITSLLGKPEIGSTKASIWHIGANPLIGIVISLIMMGIFLLPGLQTAQERFEKGNDKELYDILGPMGIILIALSVIAAMCIWWWLLTKKSIAKMIARYE